MKAKLLLMLLMSLLSLGIFASENCNNKCRLRLFVKDKLDTSMKRSLIRPFAQVEDINACLYITFQQSFENVDITIRDKEGNEVVNDLRRACDHYSTVERIPLFYSDNFLYGEYTRGNCVRRLKPIY